MKVTALPAQKRFDDVETDTLTGRFGLTVTATGALVAGLPIVQASEEVSSQVTISPATGV